MDIEIDGRRAVPVRLIRYVTGEEATVLPIVGMLAGRERDRRISLPSFHLLPDGHYKPVQTQEWVDTLARLGALRRELGEAIKSDLEYDLLWWQKSMAVLPPATFVWAEDLEQACREEFCPDNWDADEDELPSGPLLNFTPYVPPDLLLLAMEGFAYDFVGGSDAQMLQPLQAENSRLKAEVEALKQQLGQLLERDIPPYMDRAHPHFSLELQAAVSAWSAVYALRGLKSGIGHKDQIAQWIEQHYPDAFSGEAVERIATMVNFNKKGGAPRSDM